jgi:drug/metabolite transporter (DMT)-like permease
MTEATQSGATLRIAGRVPSRALAVVLMVVATTCWSIAGVVTRHLDKAQGFEVTFWRSVFAALCLMLILFMQHGLRTGAQIRALGWPGLCSGLMWATMFTAFMLALTQTSTANTLVVMSIYPLLAATLAWLFLDERVPKVTWVAIAIAAFGIGLMFVQGSSLATDQDKLGTLIAAAVPLAAATNALILKRYGQAIDLIPALLVGAVISAAVTWPWAMPFAASGKDLSLLALLGFVQLGLPCILMIHATKALSAPEIALLSLLEVIQGPLWAWLGANEKPPLATIAGGGIVITALVVNQIWQTNPRRAG